MPFADTKIGRLLVVENAFDAIDPIDVLACRELEILLDGDVLIELSLVHRGLFDSGGDRRLDNVAFGSHVRLDARFEVQMGFLQLDNRSASR